MSRLTYIFMGGDEDYRKLKRRSVPVAIDASLSMIMEMDPDFLRGEDLQEPTKTELKEFLEKYRYLMLHGLEDKLKVSSEEFAALLNKVIPCIGCRRSAENSLRRAQDFQYSAFHPICVDGEGFIHLSKESLKGKFLCSIFQSASPRERVQALVDSLPKSKPGSNSSNRCALHSIDSQRVRAVSSWVDSWESMDYECQEEIVILNTDFLLDNLQEYLDKHQFCTDCRAKVLYAYRILVEEADGEDEPGFIPELYGGIQCLKDISQIQLDPSAEFVSQLIAKAVPEIVGAGLRERHAKTMEIAQEEVLTCIGKCLFERLSRVHHCFREEEHTWEIIMCTGILALQQKFNVMMEEITGYSQLELFCDQLSREEELKQQKQEIKKQRRRRKKEKKSGECTQDENLDPADLPDQDADDDIQDSHSHPGKVETPSGTRKKKKKSRKGRAMNSEKAATLVTVDVENRENLPISQFLDLGQIADSSEHILNSDCCLDNMEMDLLGSGSSLGSVSVGSDFRWGCFEGQCNHSTVDVCLGSCGTSSKTKVANAEKGLISRPRSPSFRFPLPYRTLQEQLEDDCSSEEDERCIPEDEVILVQSRFWEQAREVFRKHLLLQFTELNGINIPSPYKHVDECLNSQCNSCERESVGNEESLPQIPLKDASGNKTSIKPQTCRASGPSKSRTGTGGQASRRYKGKNRR